MSKVYEKSWFKWLVISSATTFTGLFFLFGFLQQHLHEKEIEKLELKKFEAEKEYEDQFTAWMTRLYQNLKLDHFLAAYQNVRNMPRPKPHDQRRVDEYVQVLNRVGRGLLKAGLMREAEQMFEMVRDYRRESSEASDALTEIDARRKLQFAKTYLAEAQEMLANKDYIGMLGELQKAQIELNSDAVAALEEAREARATLMELLPSAKFYTRILDAERFYEASKKAFYNRDFKRTQDRMSKAAELVGRAAFLRPLAPEVKRLRSELRNLEADISYAIPNSMPIWNRFARDRAGKDDLFFFLDSADFKVDTKDTHTVKLTFRYLQYAPDAHFAIRYRIHLEDGTSFFNGHFILPKEGIHKADEVFETTYVQEIPERYQGKGVVRVEVKFFDHKDEVVSHIMRAFRLAS